MRIETSGAAQACARVDTHRRTGGMTDTESAGGSERKYGSGQAGGSERGVGPRLVTVTDVARAAGVAYSTASLALRGVGSVAAGTRARVLAAAAQLGWRANAAASALASQRRAAKGAGRRGLVIGLLQNRGHDRAIVEGARAGAEAFGYELRPLNWPSGKQLAASLRRWWHEGIDGLLLNPLSLNELDPWKTADLSKFCLVKIGRVLPGLPCSVVRCSTPEEVTIALDRIFAHGYRSVYVGMLRTVWEIEDNIRLGAVYAYSQRDLPEGARMRWRFHGPMSAPDPELLRDVREFGTDAYLGFPFGYCHFLKDDGWRIGKDLGYAAMSISAQTQFSGTSVAGIDPQRQLQGYAAVQRLHQLIAVGAYGPQALHEQTLVTPLWQNGDTLPPLGG